jgi:hypothetical protein
MVIATIAWPIRIFTMRKFSSRTFRLILAAAVFCMPLIAQQLTPASATRTPVLVELFTSEGCSTCPPADRLLADLKLKQPVPNTQIVALGFHVDYWDHKGWKDRFSFHQFTERQEKYAGRLHDEVYTPQLVVDGVALISDGRVVASTIAKAGAEPKPAQITFRQEGARVEVVIRGSVQPGEAFLALVEDGLETAVRGGENNGRKLEHAAVVRDWHALGAIEKSEWNTTVCLNIPSDAKKEKLQLVAFLQDPKSGKILGLGWSPVQ